MEQTRHGLIHEDEDDDDDDDDDDGLLLHSFNISV
jgi:hypothetical protein